MFLTLIVDDEVVVNNGHFEHLFLMSSQERFNCVIKCHQEKEKENAKQLQKGISRANSLTFGTVFSIVKNTI